jgi:hypothetical protein
LQHRKTPPTGGDSNPHRSKFHFTLKKPKTPEKQEKNLAMTLYIHCIFKMKSKRTIEKLTVIREAVDYLTLRINANADICRYLDKLNAADSVRVFENPNIKFVHETEIVGKLHVLRILDSFGNSI